MRLSAAFRARCQTASGDAEVKRNSPHLDVRVAFELPGDPVSIRISGGTIRIDAPGQPDIHVRGADDAWERLLAQPQPPLCNSFTALELANPDFDVSGDPLLIAQARAALDRIIECLSPTDSVQAADFAYDMEQVTGHYRMVPAMNAHYRYYYEMAGTGDVPIVFLHTAGADSRQYLWQMADVELGRRYRLYAPDMPFHGRSMPPRTWDGGPYHLTASIYRQWVAAFITHVIGAPTLIVGGSMGAAIALVMAAEQPELTLGLVAMEPPYRSKGRRNPFQDHVAVHAGLHNSAFTRGLMSPTSPLDLRRAAGWIYAQGAPGIYRGDLAFYSDEFDGGEVGPRIDAARTPVALLSGNYDFSATPEDGAKLARLIPGALHLVMPGLGHFPATEHPAHFRPWLLRGLDHVTPQHG